MKRMQEWARCAAAGVLVTAAGAGCTTTTAARDDAARRRAMEIQTMKVEIDRLRDRLEGVTLAQDEIYRRIEQLEASGRTNQAGLELRLNELATAVDAAAAARAELKREIVDSVSQRVTDVIRAQRPAARPAQRGYEHVVEAGQTLSEIAAAYNVTTEAIVNANNLPNADTIRVGQTLFIPE